MFGLLVGSGVALRLTCHDLPNFAPVAAIALFAGYFFRSMLLAACVPLAVRVLGIWPETANASTPNTNATAKAAG